jgi:hypothetical protein
MANQLQIAGAQSEKPAKFASLFVGQIFSGLWTNRSQLRDAATPFLYTKFYSANRNDSLIDGLNTELSERMTLVRRPGHSVYNSQSFPAIQSFSAFKPFAPIIGETIRVIADTSTAVYDATGPSTKTLLFNKSTGAGKTRFKGVENTLFMGDGVDVLKWSWFPAWAAITNYADNSCVLDANNNIQQSQGLGAQITSTSLDANNNLTVNYSGTGTLSIGETVTFYGMTAVTALNGASVTGSYRLHFYCLRHNR